LRKKNKKQKRKGTWKSIPRKCYLLGGSCVCVCVCVIWEYEKKRKGERGKKKKKKK